MTPTDLPWLWIPLTVWAGFAQTLRNAAQRSLIAQVGTLGATLVRFLYGLPFAALWLITTTVLVGQSPPPINPTFLAWVLEGGVFQILATALLLLVMTERNFALGVAYSKTELVQVAVFGSVLLGDPLALPAALAIFVATAGVLLLSPDDRTHPVRSLVMGWTSRSALLGFASGACFALAATGYRGGALALGGSTHFLLAAAYTLVWAQAVQVVMLGGWLLVRNRAVLAGVVRAWRTSLFAGFMGAAASVGWFTAMAIEPVAHVRTLGLVELLFSLVVSRRLFQERLSRLEVSGLALLTVGLIIITLGH
ncbi:MAG: DMT family transporter [Dehalococcoidia bacterium]|nr:DMT family transporter [Dehalococcoidia bacterium]